MLAMADKPGEFGEFGEFNLTLALYLLVSWTIVFMCLCQGIKSSGKVVYFTATFPYFIMVALLIRGVTLPGAMTGLYHLFVPKWEMLLNFTVWQKAAEQMFYSMSISWGGLIIFGSYNKFHNSVHFDAALVSAVDFFTSLTTSVVIFSVLGYLSESMGIDIDHVAEKGTGLAFVTYPVALAKLPMAWLWSFGFFFMLFLLGLDSEFAAVETFITCFTDAFPSTRKFKVYYSFESLKVENTFTNRYLLQTYITLTVCVVCFILGLPCVTSYGPFVLDLMDAYGAGFAIIFVGIWELIGFCWLYGYQNIAKDFQLMLGSQPSGFWKFTWAVTAPGTLIVLFIIYVLDTSEYKYRGVISYPPWGYWVSCGLTLVSMIQIPLWAFFAVIQYMFSGKKVAKTICPNEHWKPGDKKVQRTTTDVRYLKLKPKTELVY